MIILERTPGWRRRFEAVCDDWKREPFSWGDNDCAVGLVGRLVEAVTGQDLTAQYRGQYDDAESAYRQMRRAGFTNLADMVASILPEIHPSQAKIGDVAAFRTDSPFGFALGVVNGERVLLLREVGFGTLDLLEAERAFKVG
ncbi:DUF6950 family protein [Allorhizobium pseudoryzae]|uniref:DUF6950 family protein n=1 Tax=Allorhizobium pseudoryzae TaxID=379684 RepID=UPI003D0324A9